MRPDTPTAVRIVDCTTKGAVEVTEHVVPIDLGVRWDPNCEGAVLVTTDEPNLGCRAVLAIGPHLSGDSDNRSVVLVWDGCHHADFGSPNDHAINQHPLYDRGLNRVLWAGEVLESELVARLSQMSVWPAEHHYVFRTKGSVAEVVADGIHVERHPGPPLEAALTAMRAGKQLEPKPLPELLERLAQRRDGAT